MSKSKKLISLVVRTKNEEFWIERFLKAVKSQVSSYSVEVILVDNNSNDETVSKALSSYEEIKVTSITKYIPGTALNLGVQIASGDYVICISAHCIPASEIWIEKLISPLKEDQSIACVYGRQLPLIGSSPQDKRDLWLTFGLDSKIQKKDPFIHNANAAYRRKDLLDHPFSEAMTNIEDRGWAEFQLSLGKKIFYCSEASVYHGHGIHQTGNIQRLEGVVNMMESLSRKFGKSEEYYGSNLTLTNTSKCLIIPVSERYNETDINELIKKADLLKNNFSDWEILILPSNKEQITSIEMLGFDYLQFRVVENNIATRLISDLSQAVQVLTAEGKYFDYVASFDIRKMVPSKNFLSRIMEKLQNTGAKCGVATEESNLSTCKSVSGKSYILETKGWQRWVKNAPQESVFSLSPSNFIIAEMSVLRNDEQLEDDFCTELIEHSNL